METTVIGRHLEITDAIRQYAESKSSRLTRYFDRLSRCDLVADKVPDGFEVELISHADRTDPFIAKSRGLDLYACIDEVITKTERQLTDHKERVRNHKHSN